MLTMCLPYPRLHAWIDLFVRPDIVRNIAVAALRIDPSVTAHSPRVTALTTAQERGSDTIDVQDSSGHADASATLTYIRSRDRRAKAQPVYSNRGADKQ